ncbi:hypothetical protein HGRIS_001973 [Hohenbuehelia grisea]|uniref:P-loop containing nucleoside triphosphate hydrolase protein n=1 Tax=Hohenbuehelia grisea TaxID=104357 RepID=A0ABR3JJ13_9AGAR
MSKTATPAIRHISEHVLEHLVRATATSPPLFVAFQGPQGSGKSYLTSSLKAHLSETPPRLNVAVLSIDDLYLPHAGLRALAQEHRENKLWKGRGQPGTHDAKLGIQLLERLKKINDADADHDDEVELPVFDKSLHAGEGDRLPPGHGQLVRKPLDIVLFEGWCTGFYPISDQELEARWTRRWVPEKQKLSMPDDEDAVCTKADVQMVNEVLRNYVALWEFFNVFVQIKPAIDKTFTSSEYAVIYKWRLQQEHAMKATNGGRGMSDESVKSFVDRYIPGYVFFGDGITEGLEDGVQDGLTKIRSRPPWIGKGLRLFLGESRDVVRVEKF